MSLSAPDYGYGGIAASTAATKTGNVTDANGADFTWSEPQTRVVVQNHPDASGYLYVKVNADDAATDDWDYCITAGNAITIGPYVRVSKVAIYSDAASEPTYGTDYTVVGWR